MLVVFVKVSSKMCLLFYFGMMVFWLCNIEDFEIYLGLWLNFNVFFMLLMLFKGSVLVFFECGNVGGEV